MSNFGPVSVLNTFSKVCERVIKYQIVSGKENIFHRFYPRIWKEQFTKHFNCLKTSYRRIRKNLDNDFVVVAVLTDLSKAFNYIPHDLLIAKLSAYISLTMKLCLVFIHNWQIVGSASV